MLFHTTKSTVEEEHDKRTQGHRSEENLQISVQLIIDWSLSVKVIL